jgi:predicted phage terminase large subunit-like protein
MSIGIEANAYQDALRQTVTEHVARTGQQAHVVPITNTAAKKTRIMALSPRVEMGIVTFHQRQASLIAHMLDYPSVAHDDHEDSLAGAVQMVANTGRLSCR